jgi:hypothetical protein
MGYLQFCRVNFVWRSGRSACCRATTTRFTTPPTAKELFSPFRTCDMIPRHETGIPHYFSPKKSPLESRDLPMVPTFTRPADAKETAIVCLSAALLFASLAVLALASER